MRQINTLVSIAFYSFFPFYPYKKRNTCILCVGTPVFAFYKLFFLLILQLVVIYSYNWTKVPAGKVRSVAGKVCSVAGKLRSVAGKVCSVAGKVCSVAGYF